MKKPEFKIVNQTLKLGIALIAVVLIGGGLFYYFHLQKEELPKEMSLEEKKELSFEKTKQAESQMSKSDFSGCEKLAQEAIDLDPDNISAYIVSGQVRYVQGKLEQARDAYLAGLKRGPNNFQLNFNLANVYRDLKEFESSSQYYEKTLEINPDDPLVWLNHSFLFSLQENWNRGLEVCREGVNRFPDNQPLVSLCEAMEEKTK